MPIIRYITISTRRRRGRWYARLAEGPAGKRATRRGRSKCWIPASEDPVQPDNYMSTFRSSRALYGPELRQNECWKNMRKTWEENITYYLRFYREIQRPDSTGREGKRKYSTTFIRSRACSDRPASPADRTVTSSTKESWKIKSRNANRYAHRHGQRDATPINLPTAEGDAENLLTARTGRGRFCDEAGRGPRPGPVAARLSCRRNGTIRC